jgi:hypothetical protein
MQEKSEFYEKITNTSLKKYRITLLDKLQVTVMLPDCDAYYGVLLLKMLNWLYVR